MNILKLKPSEQLLPDNTWSTTRGPCSHVFSAQASLIILIALFENKDDQTYVMMGDSEHFIDLTSSVY